MSRLKNIIQERSQNDDELLSPQCNVIHSIDNSCVLFTISGNEFKDGLLNPEYFGLK